MSPVSSWNLPEPGSSPGARPPKSMALRVGDPAMLRAQQLLRAAEAYTLWPPGGKGPSGGGSRGPEGLHPGPPEALQVQAPQMAGATTTDSRPTAPARNCRPLLSPSPSRAGPGGTRWSRSSIASRCAAGCAAGARCRRMRRVRCEDEAAAPSRPRARRPWGRVCAVRRKVGSTRTAPPGS